jgi:hypothetical protein
LGWRCRGDASGDDPPAGVKYSSFGEDWDVVEDSVICGESLGEFTRESITFACDDAGLDPNIRDGLRAALIAY